VRLATISGRATVLTAHPGSPEARGIDVERASGGRFASDVQQLYPHWTAFRAWADGVTAAEAPLPADVMPGNPVPRPAQVFAIGLNYADHAAEAGLTSERPLVPPTFTKFPTSLADPAAPVRLPSASVDWEVELVAVIGKRAEHVSRDEAWSHVAGLAVGQDFSERVVQSAGPAPQFSLGKSYPGFGPIGPWLVTPDALADPDDLEIVCEINGEQVQKSRTSAMVWSVPELVSVLSGVCPLLPGDVIFTGTPAGVGFARKPPRFLAPGDVVVSRIEGIGEIRQECLGPAATHS
jgi:2-keto-4-pentenoate hydratase/2-oxohepta-3-ene-1,7-dioic acid hydratase in catechol pathway